MFFTAKQWIFLGWSVRVLEESKTILQTEDTTYGIVYATHRHFIFFNQFFQQCTVVQIVWFHGHVYTGIDSYLDGFFFIGSNAFAGVQVVDVGPVCNQHSVPSEILFQPFGKQFIIRVYGNSIDGTAVYHDSQSACFNTFFEGSEAFFT